jgi:hypothetical protein
MAIQFITRNQSLNYICKYDQYAVIMTPLNQHRAYDLMHLALLDYEKGEILEGVNRNGILRTQVFLVEKLGSLDSYICRREKALGFKFASKGDIMIQSYWKLPRLYKTEEQDLIAREARWDEMFDTERKYCMFGKYGWNCETVVFYILTGYPISPQGEWFGRESVEESPSDFSKEIDEFWEEWSAEGNLDLAIAPYIRMYNNRKNSNWNY